MKEKYYNAIVNGVTKKDFPPVPVDYGYRDSTNFWYTQFPKLKKPIAEPIPGTIKANAAPNAAQTIPLCSPNKYAKFSIMNNPPIKYVPSFYETNYFS